MFKWIKKIIVLLIIVLNISLLSANFNEDNNFKYDDFNSFIMSSDSKSYAVNVKKDDLWYVYKDWKIFSKWYSNLDYGSIHYSLDWNKFYFHSNNTFVINKKEWKKYDRILNVVYSKDWLHYAYIAKKDNKDILVVDWKENKTYSFYTYNYKFSDDWKSFTFYTISWWDNIIIKDWIEIYRDKKEEWNPIFQYVWNTHKVEIAVWKNGFKSDWKRYFLLDWKKSSIEYEANHLTVKKYSKDLKSSSYIVTKYLPDNNSESTVIKDWKKVGTHFSAQDIIYSLDWKYIAYRARDEKYWKSYLVVDWVKTIKYNSISWDYTFSKDWKDFYFINTDENKIRHLYKNNNLIHSSSSLHSIKFSEETNDLYFIAGEKWKYSIYKNNKKLKENNSIYFFKISENWKNIAYTVRAKNNKYSIFINNIEYNKNSNYIPEINFIWNDILNYVVIENGVYTMKSININNTGVSDKISKINKFKNELWKTSKWKTYIKKIDIIVKKIDNKKLEELLYKISKIKSKIKNKETMNIINYLEEKIKIQIWK
jgi:hypothetical protein